MRWNLEFCKDLNCMANDQSLVTLIVPELGCVHKNRKNIVLVSIEVCRYDIGRNSLTIPTDTS